MHLIDFDGSAAHYAALETISRAVQPCIWSPAVDLMAMDAAKTAVGGRVTRRLAVVDDQIVGHAAAWPMMAFDTPDRRLLQLEVLPELRGRGIGRALFADVVGQLDARVRELFAEVCDLDPRDLRFVEQLGGAAKEAEWELRVDLTAIDDQALAGHEEAFAAAGVAVRTLADLKTDVPDWLPRLHRLYVGLDADVPAPMDYQAPALESYRRQQVDVPSSLHEGLFVVLDGAEWVALSELRHLEGTRILHQDLTGVLPAWRRKGLATALKARCVRWGHAHGYTALHTWNEVDNQGMLGANAKVGFERLHQWLSCVIPTA